jgi:predicted nuclease with TOPRIM domain
LPSYEENQETMERLRDLTQQVKEYVEMNNAVVATLFSRLDELEFRMRAIESKVS